MIKERLVAEISGAPVTIDVKRVTRAKRMTLRIPPGDANPVVTIPFRASLRNVEPFVRQQRNWLAARLAERCPAAPFADGAEIPFRGELVRIVWQPGTRGTVREGRVDGAPVLLVSGDAAHITRRVSDFMRRSARADLEVAVAEFAAMVGRRPTAIRIKDTRAQWGSCTPAGVLSFSWRLVLAPPSVLRYVAAHEVAHLIELNHSADFWALNEKLDPNHECARLWLKTHGRTLHAVGGERAVHAA
ncbi:SprT family zinc-dependent metalloprotease [Acuticoccus sp. MNP-M23]|uniref:M48 family metallopeptidase n=1 Tax=Acuticoccus sp. MNP-M23 TaxID=3072793 RepID=UPI002816384B|nr:SprT family zinc-dependent metalloprotease [Acuticoccus sp. MNP-M23]WMS41559.1 SprT family zinc-dependent metalloprotease [Acuticoccus sp. MNP-M23]